MKKAIIYLGLALVTFSNAAIASTVETTSNKFELVRTYVTTTPLGVAISKGDVDAVKKFIEYGASVDELSNGMTPLMIAARYNNVEIIKMLLEKGANVKVKCEKGFTALKYAQLSNAGEAVELLKAAQNA
ncbi:ankyrin repeat domain-containing protein [Flavobacterium album]|uniref:Ankyrin repeat domain-containing protein n=1 Tax=Flavobacterium album TaxID=2175091 RepID=A0A2S1R0P5_9FLAO|nr:ankyrin repeat domain-containing protein [Flavobacterium album]AWH86253.1 ankyrin repeat domain-containing protein [Flavobacterium album]